MPSLRRKPKPATTKPGKTAGKAGGKSAPPKPSRGERAKQIRTAFTLTRRGDPRLVPLLLAAFLGPLLLLVAVGLVLGHPVYLGILGLLAGFVAVVAVFGRRMQKMQYSRSRANRAPQQRCCRPSAATGG